MNVGGSNRIDQNVARVIEIDFDDVRRYDQPFGNNVCVRSTHGFNRGLRLSPDRCRPGGAMNGRLDKDENLPQVQPCNIASRD
jgi:hypothetical protein